MATRAWMHAAADQPPLSEQDPDAEALKQEEAQVDATKGNYGLPEGEIGKKLGQHIESYTKWRSATLCGTRTGRRVQEITVSSDRSSLLRLLGWLKIYIDPASQPSQELSIALRLPTQELWGTWKRGQGGASMSGA